MRIKHLYLFYEQLFIKSLTMIILNTSAIKEWDSFTIKNKPITSLGLMEKAGNACANKIIKEMKGKESFHVIVNKGNNGGDGLVIARNLINNKYKVRVSVLEFSDNESSDFLNNLKRLPKRLITRIFTPSNLIIKKKEIIIDAIFGYGLNRIVTGKFAKLIHNINQSDSKIISIDMPSGLFNEDNRKNNGAIIKAKETYTFECMKLSLLLPSYYKYYGIVKIVGISLDKRFLTNLNSQKKILEKASLPKLIKREKFSHKGDYGHGLIIGGSKQMKGAMILSAKASMRSGLGKLSVSLPKDYIKELNMNFPEAIIHEPLGAITKYDAIAIGPGMGTDKNAEKKLKNILTQRKSIPITLDADALNIISNNMELLKLCKGSIITPHIGEFKRLCGDFNSDEEMLEKQLEFAAKYQLIIILKGAHTSIVTQKRKFFFNTTGNSGMATAGSGDVLCGIILSLLAQGYDAVDAACLSVFIHGKAGEISLEKNSKESLIASDIINRLGEVFKLLC